MSHRDRCRIQDPDECFGCKTEGVGFDGKHLTKTVRDEAGNDTREHRSGRVDVRINARPIVRRTTVQEQQPHKGAGES